jgi:hypothetical protein
MTTFAQAQAVGNKAHARHWPHAPEAAHDAYQDTFKEAMGEFDDPMAPDYEALAREPVRTAGADSRDASGAGLH